MSIKGPRIRKTARPQQLIRIDDFSTQKLSAQVSQVSTYVDAATVSEWAAPSLSIEEAATLSGVLGDGPLPHAYSSHVTIIGPPMYSEEVLGGQEKVEAVVGRLTVGAAAEAHEASPFVVSADPRGVLVTWKSPGRILARAILNCGGADAVAQQVSAGSRQQNEVQCINVEFLQIVEDRPTVLSCPWSDILALGAVPEREEIVEDVKQTILSRKPWLTEADLEVADKGGFEEFRSDSPCLIVLPDSRVRCIDDDLSDRVRAELLGLDPEELPAPKPRRPTEAPKAPARRAVKNPWYVSPDQWYTAEALRQQAEDDDDVFPYDALRHAAGDDGDSEAAGGMPAPPAAEEMEDREDLWRRLTTEERKKLDICEAYRSYLREMKKEAHAGQVRLPHFLRVEE